MSIVVQTSSAVAPGGFAFVVGVSLAVGFAVRRAEVDAALRDQPREQIDVQNPVTVPTPRVLTGDLKGGLQGDGCRTADRYPGENTDRRSDRAGHGLG